MADKYHQAFDFIDRVKSLDSIPALVDEFQLLIQHYGFNAYCVGNATAPKLAVEDRVWSATWPKGWASIWEQKKFASVDPVVYQLLASRLPFRWQDVRRVAPPEGVEVMDVAGDFNLNDGIGIPLLAQNGDTIGVTIAGGQFDLDDKDRSSLHLAAIYFQARLEKLRAVNKGPRTVDAKSSLTTRELDCLAWIAGGKTDWEIAQILSIGEQTVHTHVKNAMRKLNALHRAQAVATAIVNKMIAP